MIELDHIPTLDEAKAAGRHPSYWWAEGWNFNRPVIAEVGIGAHVHEGAYVWVRFFSDEHMPLGGYKAIELAHLQFKFTGPIPSPR